MAKLDMTTPLLDARSEYIGDFKDLKLKMKSVLINVQAFKKESEALEIKMEEAGAKNDEIKEIKKLTKWFKGIEEL